MDREKKLSPGSATREHVNKKLKPSPSSPNKIKLSIGDTVIVADKQTLTESSPYFASLLRFHTEDGLEVVSLVPPENVDVDSFLAMLHYLTNTRVKLVITAENLWDCVVLSKYFQVEQIEEECWAALRAMLPTLAIDELLRLWRQGHACDIRKATTLTLVGISFKMDTASVSTEFLDFTPDELVALMSDDGFLPILEESVCEAVRAWCEHDPENRKNNDVVLKRVGAELVWDEVTEPLIRLISPRCKDTGKIPKREMMLRSSADDCAFPDDKLLKEVDSSAGIIIRNVLYFLRNGSYSDEDYDSRYKSFYRMDMNSREQEQLDSLDMEELKFIPEDDPELADCFLVIYLRRVRLPGGDRIGCFGYYRQYLHHADNERVYNVVNIILLYDIAANKWQKLPCLPLPRTHCEMIQCGSFLYVIGGKEHKALDDDGDNAQHCFRLDLIRFTADPQDRGIQWERIANLTAPRSNHEVIIQVGRIIVYDYEGREDSVWSEAYDPALNCWTVCESVAKNGPSAVLPV